MAKKIKYTAREKVIIDAYSSVLEDTKKKLRDAELLLVMNEKYLRYKSIKFIKRKC